ncbi:unnamed protein product [Candidula unifasciata]|uniref:CN hydrolase domain-containing protein n=1 Tax=Candidula unifasciata TaxID=100452 RepID=A0A8S3Z356_9EUPU|nr:unnamed protein product [Candidula unifasciata]
MGGTYLVLLLMASFCLWTSADVTLTQTRFKAAVYGHRVIPPPPGIVSRADAVRYMRRNLHVFATQAAEAKAQGADILVFPEDGIYGTQFTRESVYNFLEQIPKPLASAWSPCGDPSLHQNTEVLHDLSCIARNNSLYLVANMGDKQPCNVRTDPKCPKDGRYQYNTNVAFDPNGTLVARYHKYHLFFEEQFDTPNAEVVYFDTPFGRFGLMVCFDVLFSEPGLSIVLKHHIANIVFPTAWMDALPLLSAVGFHSSFARALGVNFLAANFHAPERRMHGSGVYSPDGMKTFYYGSSAESPPELLVAELDTLSEPKPNINISAYDSYQKLLEPNCLGFKNDDVVKLSSEEFISELFHDMFTFRQLQGGSGRLRVCQNSICCNLNFSLDGDRPGSDLFAFGAFDGLHTYEGQYYFQICALVKCADVTDRKTCGTVTDTSTTKFVNISITAEMSTPFIYPQLVLSDGKGELLLANSTTWGFKDATLWTNNQPEGAILSAALFGRYYQRDNCPSEGPNIFISYLQTVFSLISAAVAAYIFPIF